MWGVLVLHPESLHLPPKYLLLAPVRSRILNPSEFSFVHEELPALLLLYLQLILLSVFLHSGVFQLSQFWRLLQWEALGSGSCRGGSGGPLESPVHFC